MAKQSDILDRRSSLWSMVGLLGLFLLSACGGGSSTESPQGEPTAAGPSLERLEVSPVTASLAAGTQLSLQVTGLYSDGSRRALEQDVSWDVDDANIASVDSSGHLHGLTANSTRVRASFDGLSVELPVQVTAAKLNRIEIVPDTPRLAAGTAVKLTAIGLFSDGSRQPLGDQVSWTSSDSALFSISADSQLQALATGSAVLRASLNGVFGQTTVQVSAANLTALRASPAHLELPAGTRLPLSLLGLYSDGSQQDLSARAQWQSSDAAIASLADNSLLGVSVGDTVVQASVDGLSLEIPVRVSDALLRSLELVMGAGPLPAGLDRSLRAIGHFSDGSLQDLSHAVTWRSSDDSVLAVANAVGREGLATGRVAGTVTVSASLGDITASDRLVVSAALLESLELEPVGPRLAAGTELPLTAIGRYSDGSLRVLNAQVSWSSDDALTATVANGGERPGLLKGLAVGQTNIRVRLGTVTASLPVEVSAANLMAIDIAPATISLAAGTRLALQAVGSFSDGSTQPLNAVVSWESSDPDIATVDSRGRFLAIKVAPDSSVKRLTASYAGVTGAVPFTVTAATLQSLVISPSSPALASGTQIAFSAEAVYSDGSRQDVTSQVVWDSDDAQVLRVSNDALSAGLGRGVSPGSTSVRARFQGLVASRAVTVNAALLTGLSIVAPATGLASGESLQLAVWANFSDASSQLLGREAVWSSDNPALASVGNSDGSRGRVIAGKGLAGTVNIRATYAGQSVEQALTISLDPRRPVSLVVLPEPNVLLNDNVDRSRISLRLQAADANLSVVDGTLVEVDVRQNGESLWSTTVATSGGEAGLDFTTTATGLLEIVARVSGSDVSGRGVLYAGDNPLVVVLLAAFADAPAANGVVLAGGRFGFYLFNTSNRDFLLDKFEFSNGGVTLAQVTDPAKLSGGSLTGGEKFGIVIQLSEDLQDQGLSATFFLRDPSSDQVVTYSVVYTQP